LKSELVDLGAVLADVVATFRYEAHSKGLELRHQIPELPPVQGDSDRLIQVFGNLISNAIKYTPAGQIGITAVARDGTVEIAVSDSGIGMTAEEQTRLFTKFFRGSNPVVNESRGTGLGLVIAKAILEAHGGEITAESRLGEGTCFRVMLPSAQDFSHG
jgi:signal transduction histidine kinase